MASRRTAYKFLSLAGLSLILVTCSVEKNTATTRFYHSLTARFNIFFNGNESFKAGVAKINDAHRDDYAAVLDVFEYSDPSTVNAGSADMERAIQKASKLISLKSITAKPEIKGKRDLSENDRKLLDRKEYNEWVDDSYLLIGKARFYKHEFTEAERVFNYCITEANDPEIRTEATIWLARAYNEDKNFSEAFRLLNEIEVTEDLGKGLKAMYYTTLADSYARQKRYREATEPLSKAVELVSGKRTRYRLTYLLAQMYELSGEGAMAMANYRKVVSMNPPYEVEFNARINIAGVFDIASGNPEDIKRELLKMLRDSKNKQFGDQIYFALGSLAMKEGNQEEALGYYKKSASSQSQNPNQRGRSYLALAEYYYARGDYMNAGMFYDSTVYFLDQNNPQYTDLKTRSQNLNELVSQLVIIEREDSLQRVAALPQPERDRLIASIIEKVSKDQSQGKTNDYTDRYNIGQYYENERRFQGNIEQEGKWYFYNQAALTFGRTEFRRRWGDRRLEDNWRRMNRARGSMTQAGGGPSESAGEKTDTSRAALDNKKPEFYLKDLPMTDSLLSISNEKLSVAMLNAGKAYAEKIADTARSLSTFENLIDRFPKNTLVPEALYNLYQIGKSGNATKAEAYRQRLIERYPESEYALILSDPEYYPKKLAGMKETERMYEEAYNAYAAGNFDEAIALINAALEKFPKNELSPKFMLLHAYVVARTTDERTFKEDLKILIDTWPGTPESTKASELITYLNQKMPELKVEEDKVVAAEIYKADTTSARTFALAITDPKVNLNQATFDVISYNIDNYTNKNYKTEGSLVGNKFILITVSGFDSYNQAFDYYMSFVAANPVRNPTNAPILKFLISGDNLQALQKDMDPGRYELFFRENFLK